MGIERIGKDGMAFTGNDVTRFQVHALNMGLEQGAYNQTPYFKTMFKLYREKKLQLKEVFNLYANCAKYKRSANKVMTSDEKELLEEMIHNKMIAKDGAILVDIDELIAEFGSIIR